MHMRIAAAAVLVLAGAVRGQATQPARQWDGVLTGLSSEVFAQREAAQRSLEKATWPDVETLRQLAKGTTDAEVKARLAQQIERLELENMVHPPPVSLEVKGAGIEDLAAAFSKATGVAWTTWPGSPKAGPWTLTAQERPLWDVFMALERQASLHVQNSEGKVLLQAGPMRPGGLGPIDGDWTETVAGDYLFYVGMARETRLVMVNGAPRAVEDPRPTIKLEYGFRGDPRLRLVRCGMPEIEKIVDDEGQVLYVRPTARAHSFAGVEPALPELNTALSFPAPPGARRKVTISGRMQVLEALERERVELKEVTAVQSDPVIAGGRAWRIWAGEMRGRKWVVNVQKIGGGGVPYTYIPVSIRVEDAAGVILWDGQADGLVSATVTAGPLKLPLKAIFTAATSKVGTRWVAFEFKDVPVPAAGRGPGEVSLPAELGLPQGNR